jgi:serine phosphatase RsbU (regulator of sigma subunit)
MVQKLITIAGKIRPEISAKSGPEQAGTALDVLGILWTFPFALGGLVWLILATDWGVMADNWFVFLLLLGLLILFLHYSFTIRLEVFKGIYTILGGNLHFLIAWSSALVFGETAVWLPVIAGLILNAYSFGREGSANGRWNTLFNIVMTFAAQTLTILVGLSIYRRLGGTIPFPDLTATFIWPALIATLIAYFIVVPIALPIMWLAGVLTEYVSEVPRASKGQMIRLFLAANSMSGLVYPFAILAAGLYTRYGLAIYLFLSLGAFLAGLLAHHLSRAVMRSEQRARELAALEELGRAIINADPEEIALPMLLEEHIRGMMPYAMMDVWLEPDTSLFQHRSEDLPRRAEARQKLLAEREQKPQMTHVLLHKVHMPQEKTRSYARNGLCAPINNQDGSLLGGIYLLVRQDYGPVMDYLPAVQSLAAQIASAMHRLEVYRQTIAHEKMAQELAVAGRIQETFLPKAIPEVEGWEMTAVLQSARQTSGDFYDFVTLGNGRLGLLVADVADKGTGAALYMALSRTLIRTYAMQYPDAPEKALQAANERILADTESDQFVTVFYGVLDTNTGTFTYANAGHNPAYLFSSHEAPLELARTGVPLGMFEKMQWRRSLVQMAGGDLLVLYTDGVTEAQDADEVEFGQARLIEAMGHRNGRSASELQTHLLQAIETFVGDAPQFDDITAMLVARE